MPTLSWESDHPAPSVDTVTVFASEFEAPSFRIFAGLLRDTPRVARQLRKAEGCLGYALGAHPPRRQMTTVSIWRDGASMRAFVAGGDHASSMNSRRGTIGRPRFATRRRPSDTRIADLDPAALLADPRLAV